MPKAEDAPLAQEALVCPSCSTLLNLDSSTLPAPTQSDQGLGWWFSCGRCNHHWWQASISPQAQDHEKELAELRRLVGEFDLTAFSRSENDNSPQKKSSTSKRWRRRDTKEALSRSDVQRIKESLIREVREEINLYTRETLFKDVRLLDPRNRELVNAPQGSDFFPKTSSLWRKMFSSQSARRADPTTANETMAPTTPSASTNNKPAAQEPERHYSYRRVSPSELFPASSIRSSQPPISTLRSARKLPAIFQSNEADHPGAQEGQTLPLSADTPRRTPTPLWLQRAQQRVESLRSPKHPIAPSSSTVPAATFFTAHPAKDETPQGSTPLSLVHSSPHESQTSLQNAEASPENGVNPHQSISGKNAAESPTPEPTKPRRFRQFCTFVFRPRSCHPAINSSEELTVLSGEQNSPKSQADSSEMSQHPLDKKSPPFRKKGLSSFDLPPNAAPEGTLKGVLDKVDTAWLEAAKTSRSSAKKDRIIPYIAFQEEGSPSQVMMMPDEQDWGLWPPMSSTPKRSWLRWLKRRRSSTPKAESPSRRRAYRRILVLFGGLLALTSLAFFWTCRYRQHMAYSWKQVDYRGSPTMTHLVLERVLYAFQRDAVTPEIATVTITGEIVNHQSESENVAPLAVTIYEAGQDHPITSYKYLHKTSRILPFEHSKFHIQQQLSLPKNIDQLRVELAFCEK